MAKVIRPSDMAQSHGYMPLCQPLLGSENVITNGEPTVRIGDPYTPPVHCIAIVCHGVGAAVGGSPNVIVNGMGVHRDGDMIGCGTVADNGSANVLANQMDGAGLAFLGDDDDNTIGYVPHLPRVEYRRADMAPVYICRGADNSIDPWDGHEGAGYLPIFQEDQPFEPGGEAGRNYPTIGMPQNLQGNIPPYWWDPQPMDYELKWRQRRYEFDASGNQTGSTVNNYQTAIPQIYGTFDSTTGRFQGEFDDVQGSFGVEKRLLRVWVRARSYVYDDIQDNDDTDDNDEVDSEEEDLAGTFGPWWEIAVQNCD